MRRWLMAVLLTANAAQAADTVTLYYWGKEDDTMALDMIQDFESLHDGSDGEPAIKVIMGQSASINKTDDPQRLLCAVAGGDPPDVVHFDRFAVGEWAARGALEPLQPFLDRDLVERPDDPFTLHPGTFYRACWEEACYKDTLFAVPFDTDNRALFYNIDVLEKFADELIPLGCVDPDDPSEVGPPRTWEQLMACVKVITTKDARGDLVRIGFLPHSPNFGNSWLYIYGWLNGGRFMSPDGRTCLLDSEEIVGALTYMTRLYDVMGGAQKVVAFQSGSMGGDLDPFLAGKIAMKIDGDGYMVSIINVRRDTRFGVSLAPAPEGKQRLGWCGGFSFVIPKGAKHKKEAWTFIKYLCSKRGYQVRTDGLRQAARSQGNVFIPYMSARRDVTEWAMEKYLYSDPTIPQRFKDAKRVFVDAMPFSKYRPVTPVGQLLWNEQVRGMEAGIYKQFSNDPRKNAQIALNRSAAIVQKRLNETYNPREYPTLHWGPVVVGYLLFLLLGFAGVYWFFSRQMSARGYFRKEYRAGYLFASPWFIGFIFFGGGPIIFSLFMSFCHYDVFTQPQLVGLENYREMLFDDPLFYKCLWNTLFMAFGIPLSMMVSLAIAMLLNFEIKGMAVYRTFFYLPAIMPAVAASILWLWIFNPQEGILNNLLAQVGIRGPLWLHDADWSKPALILMGLWGAGGGMIVWLAGLKGIPTHLYEAAAIDGAGPIRRFWNVTLPMISPYILFNLVMGLINTFQIFSQAYIMTRGGPQDSTLFYAYALFNNAFRYMRMGYASAMAWVLFGIVLVLTVLQLKASRHWVHYETDS